MSTGTLIFIVIIATIVLDFLLGKLFLHNKNKQIKRDNDLFQFKLEETLKNKTISFKDRRERAMEICRMTKGEFAAGAYITLDNLEDLK